MARVVWDETGYEAVLEARCGADPAAVYAVLADLSTHLDWGGQRQRRSFGLRTLDPAGTAGAGTAFDSTGTIPMTGARWVDHSVVVRAEPAALLEFHTDGRVEWPGGLRTAARWEHRYAIEPDGTGSRVEYRLRRATISGAPLRMRVPVMRTVTHRVMIPFLCRRGFLNLLREAERRSVATSAG